MTGLELRILRALARGPRPPLLPEPPAFRRAIRSLLKQGYIEVDEHDVYRITPAGLEMKEAMTP